MKKRTKLTFAGIVTIGAAILLSGCTASFCSKDDKAHILYAFDYGVSDYYDGTGLTAEQITAGGYEKVWEGNDNVYFIYNLPISTSSGLGKANSDAVKNYIQTPSSTYYKVMDRLVLEQALKAKGTTTFDDVKFKDVLEALDEFGYLKYAPSDTLSENKEKLWTGWDDLNQNIRDLAIVAGSGIVIDDLPTNDWVNLYKKDMNSLISAYRSCLSFKEEKFGYYGYANGAQYRENNPIDAVKGKVGVTFEKKDWGYAWKKGFLEGLLIFPIGWLTDTFINGFKNMGMGGGVPQLLAIFLVTFIIRSLWLLVTFRNTRNQAKMQALQPEMAKIQNKYPNANKNQYEKQQMAAEMNRLYKKNKVNPFSTIIIMFFQFPLFICVWSAFQGLSSLTNDTFLKLHLSDTISGVLFNGANWANGSAFTALGLFLVMAATQIVSMLLPQWIQKQKRKKIATLGKNPAQKEQQSKTKMFTYMMTAMVLFMGFTLVSALGVYWIVGAIFQICQTLIFEKINNRKGKKKGN